MVWTEEDIYGGRRFMRADENELWMIGWLMQLADDEVRWVIISTFDGTVLTPPQTAKELALHLTHCDYEPVPKT